MLVVKDGRCGHIDPAEFNQRTPMKKNLTYGVIIALAMSGTCTGVSFAAETAQQKPAAAAPATEKRVETKTEQKVETKVEPKAQKKPAVKVKKTVKKPAVKKSEVKPAVEK